MKTSVKRRAKNCIRGTVLLACFIAVWYVASCFTQPLFIPAPATVWEAIVGLAETGQLQKGLAYSFLRITGASALSMLVAIPLSLLIYGVKPIKETIMPVVSFLRYVPVTAFSPLLILWFGIGEQMKISFLFIATFVYLLPSILLCFNDVPQDLMDTGKTIGMTSWETIKEILLPASLPSIFSTFLMMYGIGWTYCAVVEATNAMEIIHTIIHPIFTLAVRDNYIRINPATGAMAEIKKSHNWEKPKRHALTIAEQTAFIDYMRNHKVYNHWLPLFTVLLGTGCRIGEAIGLRWEDCDFDEGIISINHNMVYRKYEEDEKARFHIVTPKTSAGVRIVPMLSEVKAALQAEWETQKIVGFNESVVDGYTGFIFQNRYGDPLSPHSVNRAIDRICDAYIEDETVLADQEGRDPVLIRHFSAHNLRHTFCTRFCENERNIKVIQEIMGHADIETTMNIYAEATKEKKKESFSNLEGKIKIS